MSVRVLRNTLKYLLISVGILYFLIGGFLLIVKYWMMPRIDNWRPEIESRLSQALDAQVTIGKINAEWGGLSPRFAVTDFRIDDQAGEQGVLVPEVEAILSWRSVTSL